MQADSCSGLRFPVEPVPGPATSPVVTRHGLLGQDAGLWSPCLFNSLPQGAVEKLNQLLKTKISWLPTSCEAVYGLRDSSVEGSLRWDLAVPAPSHRWEAARGFGAGGRQEAPLPECNVMKRSR